MEEGTHLQHTPTITTLEEAQMFYNVRILGPDGKIKKVINSGQLSNRHWKNFLKMESSMNLSSNGRPNVPGWIKKKLEMEYPDYKDPTCYH